MRFSLVLLLGLVSATNGLPKPGLPLDQPLFHPAAPPAEAARPAAQTPNIGHFQGSGAAESTKELTFVHLTGFEKASAEFESILGTTTREESQTWSDDFIRRMFETLGVDTARNGHEQDKFKATLEAWQFRIITPYVVIINDNDKWSVVSSAEAATITGDKVMKAPSPCSVIVRADYWRKRNSLTFLESDHDRNLRNVVFGTLQIPWNKKDEEMARKFHDAKYRVHSL
ncbi:hypothetical protein EV361DRAFT_1035592 [Lentinula raphanica]|nr:hypothetical protein EV361DRAFT_1035592 [Lentinula raphanica]